MLESGIAQLVIAGESAAAIAVRAIIGTRFYPVVPPEDVTYPCCTFQVISDVPDYLLGGDQALEVMRIQIDSWSGGSSNANYSDAKSAQLAIRLLLAGQPGTPTQAAIPCFSGPLPDGTVVAAIFVANAEDGYEQDARAYRARTDYMVHFYPAAG